jgi:CPA2 family monovalent cation:H+ antiporter-2
VAAALAQIGEFSFILAAPAGELGLLSAEAIDALVAASIISISLNPLVYQTVKPLNRRLAALSWGAALLRGRPGTGQEGWPASSDDVADPRYRALIVGYGPVGRTLARLLREQGIEPGVIEMNLETVQRLKNEGVPAFYGDATLLPTLQAAGVGRVGTFVLSIGGFPGATELIRMVRELNPRVRVLARTSFLADIPALVEAGADRVFASEGEVALAMAEAVLDELGATPEQIDRQRARVHAELAPASLADSPAGSDGPPAG